MKGKYLLRVVASDGEATTTAVVTVLVSDGSQNIAPMVNAGPDLNIQWPRNVVNLGTRSEADYK